MPTRTVQVWLPPDYATGKRRYPVIYLHDGQNVYDDPSPWSGKSWAVHRALSKLIAERKVRPAILVAVWNTDNRIGEYMPEAAVPAAGAKGDPGADDLFRKLPVERAKIAGDAYLKFLAEELKPLIDARYRTLARCPRHDADGIEHGRIDLGLCAGALSAGVRRGGVPVDRVADRRRLYRTLVRIASAAAGGAALFRLWDGDQ